MTKSTTVSFIFLLCIGFSCRTVSNTGATKTAGNADYIIEITGLNLASGPLLAGLPRTVTVVSLNRNDASQGFMSSMILQVSCLNKFPSDFHHIIAALNGLPGVFGVSYRKINENSY